ncbi:Piso0_003914 [Millerozyma farinosa CBS 7064]|uniref:Origin recognition complex subunit 1 n=1 Tax=Pichia sorbitophila (strain ATCC MYA-4447 / BCRC 22081 / CBS 7064 / NBRC 10061 / NRRL Y-12695) TaxID=559304 RepID=G8Y9V6_PICSO|nr:Piso0_003914 [Millerozyma farinosa CBS 7064]CCE84370.1 Piso0_003914 [Millerozyma farinosa CBS 7064]
MARSQKHLAGWELLLGEENENKANSTKKETRTPTRRRRGDTSTASQTITLRRNEDELEVKEGSMLLVQQQGNAPEVALVTEVRFGAVNFIDIVVVWFIKIEDIEFNDLPKQPEYAKKENLSSNELFVTAYLDEIKLSEIIGSVNVMSDTQFKEDIVLDESNASTTFFCRRGCDSAGEIFTDRFDFADIYRLFQKNKSDFFEYIREGTIPSAYNAAKDKKPKIEKTEKTTKAKKPGKNDGRKRESTKSVSPEKPGSDKDKEDNGSSHTVKQEDQEHETPKKKLVNTEIDGEGLTDDSDEEQTTRKKSKYSSPSKASPSKRGRKKVHEDKDEDNSRKFITSMITPLNKRLKIKDSSKPSGLSLSPRKQNKHSNPLGIDFSSQAFKELKAKLHTSTKLSFLPCREDEFTSVYLSLETAIREEIGCCIYVSGTPGVGKTATIREVIDQLRELSQTGELNEFDYLEINGLKLLTPSVAYEILWEKICGAKISPSNAALLLENYFSKETERRPLVVLMDELDQIVTKKQNVMYNFFNWPSYAHSKLIVIAVANTMDLPERVLSNKISSRLGLRRIQFVGYTFEQLGVIIRHRLEMLSQQNKRKVIVSDDAVGFASRKVASVSGDARRALSICRRAVEIAEDEYLRSREHENDKEGDVSKESYTVTIAHISKAINETINSPVSQYLSGLSFASKLVLTGVLLRMKRSGLAENSLGDIIDEMEISLTMLSSSEASKALSALGPDVNIIDILYKGGLFSHHLGDLDIRIARFKEVINELVEMGILMQQNIRGERHRLITLNVSQEEVLSVLQRDTEISGMLR